MTNKLKGCRPSATVSQDISNSCAQLGLENYTLSTVLPKKIQKLTKHIEDLYLELDSAIIQEKVNKQKEELENTAPKAAV